MPYDALKKKAKKEKKKNANFANQNSINQSFSKSKYLISYPRRQIHDANPSSSNVQIQSSKTSP